MADVMVAAGLAVMAVVLVAALAYFLGRDNARTEADHDRIPSGWRLVPYEPTNPMLAAAAKALSPGKRPTEEWVSVRQKHRIRYQAMLDAAPGTCNSARTSAACESANAVSRRSTAPPQDRNPGGGSRPS